MSVETMTQALETLELFASDESDNGQIAISAYVALQLAIQQAQTQEPIGSVADNDLKGFIASDYSHILVYPKGHYHTGGVDLYTAPQKREWVGLTKEEFFEIYNSPVTIIKQMSMIEAKLKEKNT